MTSSWIRITNNWNDKNMPSEIRVEKNGEVYIDGKQYNEDDPKYKTFSINVEKSTEVNMGEETKKLLKLQKTAKTGEKKVVTDIKGKNKVKQTTVRF